MKLLCSVKQGDPLSPVTFNLVMNELFDALHQWIGAEVNTGNIYSLTFVDDIILVSETETGIKELIKITEDFFAEQSMNINEN